MIKTANTVCTSTSPSQGIVIDIVALSFVAAMAALHHVGHQSAAFARRLVLDSPGQWGPEGSFVNPIGMMLPHILEHNDIVRFSTVVGKILRSIRCPCLLLQHN